MYWIIFISFVLFNYKIASKISNKHFEEIMILGFVIYSTSIILSGYILSEINQWNSRLLWCILPFLITSFFYYLFNRPRFISELSTRSAFKVTGSAIQSIYVVFKNLKSAEKIAFGIIFWSIVVISLIQYSVIFNTPPNEWDSMTGHLNRILYFLNQGSTKHLVGTNWNIDTYPKSFCSIQVYPFLMSGYNEHFFKLPNFGAFWLISFASYGVLKQLGAPYKTRLFISLIVILAPNIILQSTLTDTDIVLGAYLISLIYFLLSYFNTKKLLYLYVAGIVFSLALSHKITFVFSFIPLLILYVYILFKSFKFERIKYVKHLFISHSLSIIFLIFPTGYLANIKYYDHPIGPSIATKHQSVERAGSLVNLILQGSRNVLRYTFDLLNLDGLRNIQIVEEMQKNGKNLFKQMDRVLHLGLEKTTEFTIIPFDFNKRFEFYNGSPIFGTLLILMIIPSIILYLRKPKFVMSLFLLGFIFHFLALSFSAPYDPWKGRYMISSLLFLFPILTYWGDWFFYSNQSKFKNSLFIFGLFLVCASAISTLLFNVRALPFATYGAKSIFSLKRMEALTISRPDITKAYIKFDSIVPQNAIVALATINDDYEYPLWGKNFTRKLIPINPFNEGIQPVPRNAQYLFFDASVIRPLKNDIRLGTDFTITQRVIVRGEDYYLRKLN